nr:hypothetical protein [Bacillus pumilus]
MLFFLRLFILGLFSVTSLSLFVYQGIEVVHAITSMFGSHES